MAHLFFDLDRTLWHHEANHHLFFKFLHTDQNWSTWGTATQWADAYLKINDRLWDHIQLHNLGVEYVRARRFPLLFKHMGLPVTRTKELEALGIECEARLKEHLPDMGASYAGVREAMDQLRTQGHRLHVVTNGVREPQLRKIAALGLSAHFEVVTTSDAAKAYKPDIEIFKYALRMANARPEDSWMVGDSVLRDVLGGRAAGMRTAWFAAADALPPDATGEADLKFGDWTTFPGMLEAVLQRG